MDGHSVPDEESDLFLCAVAAESVSDALLVLTASDVKSNAELHLREALSCLIEEAGIDPERFGIEPPDGTPQRVSPRGMDIIMEMLQSKAANPSLPSGIWERPLDVRRLDPTRRRAVMLMIEAIPLLDQVDDTDSIGHLQIAIDHAFGVQHVKVRRLRPSAQN